MRLALAMVLGWGLVSPCVAAEAEKAPPEAQAFYEKTVDGYMHARWTEFDADVKDLNKFSTGMTADQRKDITYIRKAATDNRPPWWKSTKSSSNKSFQVKIWGKTFMANYVPSELLGAEAVAGVDPATGKLVIVVTWQPHLVDSPKPLEGEFETAHQLTEGHLAEAIVWHELGHNYVTQGLPAEQVMQLFVNHRLLFTALQEFYADMTSMYHCSPPGRKATMMVRVPSLAWNDVNDPHVRAAHGIGSFILSQVLSDPKKWPSFHLPLKAPEKDVEMGTILYMYTHLDSGYTLAEDRELRNLVGQLLLTKGASILRSRGTIQLPAKMTYKFLTAEDREFQSKRDEWVKAELEKAVASGLIKKPDATKGHPKRFHITSTW